MTSPGYDDIPQRAQEAEHPYQQNLLADIQLEYFCTILDF